MDCGETLDARCNMRQEWRLCDVVQTFELSNKDSGSRESLLSETHNQHMPTTRLMYIYTGRIPYEQVKVSLLLLKVAAALT